VQTNRKCLQDKCTRASPDINKFTEYCDHIDLNDNITCEITVRGHC
jgi:hypothetical protein